MKPKRNRRTKWKSKERKKVKNLIEELERDVVKISKELRRYERSLLTNRNFALNSESDANKKLIVKLLAFSKRNRINHLPCYLL